MWLLSLVSALSAVFDGVKNAATPAVTAKQIENNELIHKDRMSGMSEDQIQRNIRNGRYIYKIPYAEPHKNEKGQFLIENDFLYNMDCDKFGSVKAQKWVRQGKYNLTPAEKRYPDLYYKKKYAKLGLTPRSYDYDKRMKEIEEIDRELATIQWDCTKTEAAVYWQRAHEINGD